MSNPKWFQKYDKAVEEAKSEDVPLWDTHSQPDRYMVGHPTVEDEEAPENGEWEQLDPNQD